MLGGEAKVRTHPPTDCSGFQKVHGVISKTEGRTRIGRDRFLVSAFLSGVGSADASHSSWCFMAHEGEDGNCNAQGS